MAPTRFEMNGLIALAISALIVSGTGAFQCSEVSECSCLEPSHNGAAFELHCSPNGTLEFIVSIHPKQYVQFQCIDSSTDWSSFKRLGPAISETKAKFITFRMCDLPKNESLGTMARRLGVAEPSRLVFQSFGNLNSSLTRQHLQGLASIRELVLSNNGLTELPEDVLDDMVSLTWLDLRANSVRRLPRKLFDGTPDLEVLELGNNAIDVVEPSTFDNLTRLTFLNIWKNRLNDEALFGLKKLTSVKSLDLNFNGLTNPSPDAFGWAVNLETLNLSRNNFSSLPSELLANCTKLKTLNLSFNSQNMTISPGGFMRGLDQLVDVKFTRSKIQKLPEDVFWGATRLKNLTLDKNFLVALPKEIFRDAKELEHLSLNFNDLASLPDGLFATTEKLKTLDLSQNKLTVISATLFSELTSLTELNLERNGLTTIDDKALGALHELRIARFSYNQLTLTPNASDAVQDEYGTRSPFQYCVSLTELYLNENNISYMFADWVVSSPQLRVLDLSYNQLQNLSVTDLQFVSSDIKVDLTHNNISHIFLRNADILVTDDSAPRDVRIYIEDNPILCDCYLYDLLRYLEGRMHPGVQNLFHIVPGSLTCSGPKDVETVPVTKLRSRTLQCQIESLDDLGQCPKKCTCWLRPDNRAFVIDCSYKNFTAAPEKMYNVRDYQVEMNLMGNFLTEMPSIRQPGYEKVTKLYLGHNNISNISVNSLSPRLTVLELDHNNLTRIDEPVLEFLKNSTALKELTLHANPWKCDCEARDFLNFVQNNFTAFPRLLDVKCPDSDVPLSDMTVTELCPIALGLLIGSAMAIALVGLIVGTLAALYYRYQREVKVWLYARQWCLWLVTEDELDKDKLFDAFISYSHKDEEFVINELVKKLEQGPRPFKLCLHFRDWLAGEWIPTQIARSVEDSRRTVVVLSPNFLESIWGRMEFRAAHSQALSEGRARVIVVLYGDIGPTDDLDPELKAYLSMNTYVKWGDPWFWDKLRYALPHPPELTKRKRTVTGKIFEKHQPRIRLHGDKNELIRAAGAPVTPPAVTTPPADAIKTFAVNGSVKRSNVLVESLQDEATGKKLNGCVTPVFVTECEKQKTAPRMEVHCTTV